MRRIQNIPLLFLFSAMLFAPYVFAQEGITENQPTIIEQEESAPEGPITYDSPLEEMIALTVAINGRMLEGDIATIPEDIQKLRVYIEGSSMTTEQKERAFKELDTMALFFSPENGGEVTPTNFLLANNEIFKELNDFHYQENEDIQIPAYMYQLQHLARKLQYQVLEGDWESIEEYTADTIVDLVSDIYRNLEDPRIWQNTIRPINEQLYQAIEDRDVTRAYGAGQGYLNAAPLIETAVMKKIEKEEIVKEEKKKKNNLIAFVLIGALLLIGVLLFVRRRL